MKKPILYLSVCSIFILFIAPIAKQQLFDLAFKTAGSKFEQSLPSLSTYRDDEGYISTIQVSTSFYDSGKDKDVSSDYYTRKEYGKIIVSLSHHFDKLTKRSQCFTICKLNDELRNKVQELKESSGYYQLIQNHTSEHGYISYDGGKVRITDSLYIYFQSPSHTFGLYDRTFYIDSHPYEYSYTNGELVRFNEYNPTPSASKKSAASSSKQNQQESFDQENISFTYDPYDVYSYDSGEEFADDWAEEFAYDWEYSESYDNAWELGYEDAYEYWEEHHK